MKEKEGREGEMTGKERRRAESEARERRYKEVRGKKHNRLRLKAGGVRVCKQ
jgi:hypothetical protein